MYNLKVIFIDLSKYEVNMISEKVKSLGITITGTLVNTNKKLKSYDYSNYDLIFIKYSRHYNNYMNIIDSVKFLDILPAILVTNNSDKKDISSLNNNVFDKCINLDELNNIETILFRQIKSKIKYEKLEENTKKDSIEKEEIFHILTSIGDGIITTDINMKITFMNEIAEKTVGYSSNIFRGQYIFNIVEMFSGINGNCSRKLFQEILHNKKSNGVMKNITIISKDHSIKYISSNISPLKNKTNDIIGLAIVFRNVTKIKNIENQLYNERNNLKKVINTTTTGMIIINENFEIKDANKTFLKMFNTNYEKILNKKIGYCINCGDSIKSIQGCGYSTACSTCKFKITIENTFKLWKPSESLDIKCKVLKNGTIKNCWYKINTAPLIMEGSKNVLVSIFNITEYKDLQEGLTKSRNFYSSILENSPDLVWKIDKDKKCNFLNKNWEDFTGESLKKLIETRLNTVVPIDDMNNLSQGLDKVIQYNKVFEGEFRLKRFDGEYRWMQSVGRPFNDINGNLSGYVGRAVDITEKRLVSKQLLDMKEAAEAANRAKSEFLANMSHEIRTPLNGIIGMTDLTMLTELNEDQKENLSILRNCADSLLSIINDILDFSKIEAGKMVLEETSFNLRNIIQKALDINSSKAKEKSLVFKCNVNFEIPTIVLGDCHKLQQILNNLISNAVKFTEKGSISIDVKIKGILEEAFEVLFIVKDTGIGIDEDKIKMLFKSFNQLDSSITRKYGGTGLGLAISKQLVELMGGNINVRSEKGKGSEFYFTVKLKKCNNVAKEKDNELDKSKVQKNKKYNILLAEDNKINQLVIKRMLNEIGYNNVTVVSDGIEALEMLENVKYDIVLMDIQMPMMNGIEATEIIRKKEKGLDKHIPIIAITAYALQGEKDKFLSKGMDDYISKPVEITKLMEVLNRVENIMIHNNKENTLDEYIMDYIYKSKDKSEKLEKNVRISLQNKLNELNKYMELVNKNDKEALYHVEKVAHLIKEEAISNNLATIKTLAFKIELSARKRDIISIVDIIDKIYSEISVDI